jgi:hypothetical protein
MFDDKKRLLFIIFTMIFATVILGMVTNDDSANASGESSTPDRVHKITRVVRTADPYFGNMSDDAIVRAGRILCTTLRNGEQIETFLYLERDIPAGSLGTLVETAISLNCPEYRPALQGFIDRNS